MKKNIIFLAILLFVGLYSQAQNTDSFSAPLHQLRKGMQLKACKTYDYRFDSLYFYRDDFENFETPWETRQVVYKNNTDTLELVNVYDHTHQLKQFVTYEYATNDNLITEIFYDVDPNTGDKIYNTRTTYKYNTNGLLEYSAQELYFTDLMEWQDNQKYIYTYKADGKIDRIQTQWGIRDWVDLHYEQYYYNSMGNIDYIERIEGGEGSTNILQKRTYNYNSNNFVSTIVEEQKVGNSWVFLYDITFTYDNDNDIISRETSSGFKSTYEYDKTIDIADVGGPFETYVEDYIINLIKHPITKSTSYLYQFDEWQASTSITLTYKDHTENIEDYTNEQKSLSIYPNPIQEQFFITLENNVNEAQINIFDNKGKIVMQQNVQPNAPINVSTLSNGTYFVQTKTKQGLYMNKIIINR